MSEKSSQIGKVLDKDYFTNRDRFLELVESIRPNLHRFASRMCGSVVDREDIVQEALAKAFFKLDELSDVEKLESWMFTITHRKVLDLLKARKPPTLLVDEESLASISNIDDVEIQFEVNRAIKTMIVTLPPKERACVVLKEVLGFSLLEIADIVDSTEGGVKAALHRARAMMYLFKSLNTPKFLGMLCLNV
ncbi:MAG: RNA polymerase sigma factor [Proteobacteria bacterium]|nr:RNA polymerase sigma factor [Pseudomonadota bacterium]